MSDAEAETKLAHVVHIIDSPYKTFRVALNKGAHDGVKIGDRFLVYGYGPRISDIVTGEDLGRIEIVRGRGTISHVQDRMATLRSIERRERKKPPILDQFAAAPARPQMEEEELPFLDVQIGDVAKPLSEP